MAATLNESWLERERNTGRLVRLLFDRFGGRTPPPAQIHALCKLTWITKAKGEVADNTRAVVAPALSVLLGNNFTAGDPGMLGREIRAAGIPVEIARPAAGRVGFVNFYAAFRNTSETWIGRHIATVWSILVDVAGATADEEVRDVYDRVDALPPLPRRGGANLPAFNLLTPVLACLDPRGRAPIINSREDVKARLRRLGLGNGTLVVQFDGLVNLINQAGLDDAFALDTAEDEQIEKAVRQARLPRKPATTTGTSPKPLGARQDEDVEYLRSTDTVRMRRLHNSMTNALRAICARAGLTIDEGSDPTCLFDALVRSYIGTERHLLIEVKTDAAPPMCRMAVGQLFDYRRRLGDRAAIDLAVLFPEMPPKDALDFLGYVGVKAIWFTADMAGVEGQVALGTGLRSA